MYFLPEWFSTEDWQLGKGEEAGVDGQAELYGQLGRHHAGQDECTLQEQLVSVPAIAKIVLVSHRWKNSVFKSHYRKKKMTNVPINLYVYGKGP